MINLEQSFEREIETLTKAFLSCNWENPAFYKTWMNQHYYLVQHSTRFLSLCASKVEVDNPHEFQWWTHHLKEELGHDQVLANDLKKAGVVSLEAPYAETKSIVASQYFEIEKNGYDAQLGYVLLLEGLACQVCEKIANRVLAHYGFDSKFMRLHGDVDEGHYPEGIERIKRFSEERKQVIKANLETSSRMYQILLRSILENVATTAQFTAQAESRDHQLTM